VLQFTVFGHPIHYLQLWILKKTFFFGREVMRVWSLIVRGKHRIRVFQKIMLRRMFWPNTEEVKMWGRLHVKMFWAWRCSFMMWGENLLCPSSSLHEPCQLRLYYIDTVDKCVQLQMIVTNKMKSWINSVNACSLSLQKLWSYLPSNNLRLEVINV
jgi:hypothetical protein